MFVRRVARQIIILVATALAGALLTASLIRYAPGFGGGEDALNTQISQQTKQQRQAEFAAERNPISYLAHTLAGYAHGDLGVSHEFQRPVRELIAERAPETLKSLAVGLIGGWAIGLALAVPFLLRRSQAFDFASSLVSGLFFCFPAAALALIFLITQTPARFAIALLVFPKVFRTARSLLLVHSRAPYVITALAGGTGGMRLFLRHLMPCVASPLLALAGATITLAFSAIIPVEAVCGNPGLGELAWRAALARDLPLLMNLTLMVAVLTVAAGSLSDFAAEAQVQPL